MTSAKTAPTPKLVRRFRTSERVRAGLLLALVAGLMVTVSLLTTLGGSGSGPAADHVVASGPPSGVEVLGAMNGPG